MRTYIGVGHVGIIAALALSQLPLLRRAPVLDDVAAFARDARLSCGIGR